MNASEFEGMPSAENETGEGRGSTTDLEAALARCKDQLLRRINWMMGCRVKSLAEPDDFLGEVMARLLSSSSEPAWRNDSHFLALATRIARHAIVDVVRRPRVHRFDSFSVRASRLDQLMGGAEQATPSQAANLDEDRERLLRALESLSEDHQHVIELRDFDGLAFAEIGGRMGRSEAASQMLHARARIELGRYMLRT